MSPFELMGIVVIILLAIVLGLVVWDNRRLNSSHKYRK